MAVEDGGRRHVCLFFQLHGQLEMLDISRAYGLDFLFPEKDEIIGKSLKLAGEFAKAEMDILCQLAAQTASGTYLDVGANIGTMALPVAKQNPDTTVIAVEANRHIATILAGNAILNRLNNVEVIHAAVGANIGITAFPTPALGSFLNFGALNMSQADDQSIPHENVRVCTLDEIAPANTTLVKLDVEGYEMQVMAGGQKLLHARKASWVFEFGGTDKSEKLIQMFLDAGYDAYWLYAPFTTPTARKSVTRLDSLAGDANVLAMPRGSGGPPVDMTRVENASQDRPARVEGYPYLRNYGFK